jgi:hypothetical protein
MTTEKLTKQELNQLAQEIAENLGNDWFNSQDDEGYHKHLYQVGTNAKLYVSQSYGTKSTHVVISGSLHVGRDGQYVEVYENVVDSRGGFTWERQSAGEISVAIARGPAVIAKEIQRRFLPHYLHVLALAEAKVVADTAYETDVRLNLRRLAKAADTTVTFDDTNRWDKREAFSLSIGEVYGTVHASTKTATLELRSLTIKQAEAILQALAYQHDQNQPSPLLAAVLDYEHN